MRGAGTRRRRWLVLCVAALVPLGVAVMSAPCAIASNEPVHAWMTTVSGSSLVDQLAPQPVQTFGAPSTNSTVITVDPTTTYQTIDGFGGALTDAAAYLIYTSPARNAIMQALFGPGGADLNVVRLPIGATDLSLSDYTYDDSCCSLSNFSIAPADAYVIPLLQQAEQINPNLRVVALPWSAPAWMKFGDTLTGDCSGSDNYLINSYFPLYAQYLADTVAAYRAVGVPIDALSMQNEPENCNSTYPTMNMQPADQSNFALDLRAALNVDGFAGVQVIAGDTDWYDGSPAAPTTYPQQVLAYNDSQALGAINGVAYHCYDSPTGAYSVQSTFHAAYPSETVYFTECSGGAWATDAATNLSWELENNLIGPLRNWASTSLYWSLALDPSGGPNLGGCSDCRGMVTVDDGNGTYTLNAEYDAWAQLSIVAEPGAVRVDSTQPDDSALQTVAFKNPDGSIGLVVLNSSSATSTFAVDWGAEAFQYSLPAGAVVSFKWLPTSTPAPAYFAFVNRNSGDCADASGWGTANGTVVDQWACGSAQANQEWQLIPAGSGYDEVLNRNAASDGEALNVTGGPAATANGDSLQLWPYSGASNEQFEPIAVGGGYDELMARNSGKCVEVPNASTSNGTGLEQWTCDGAPDEQFTPVAKP